MGDISESGNPRNISTRDLSTINNLINVISGAENLLAEIPGRLPESLRKIVPTNSDVSPDSDPVRVAATPVSRPARHVLKVPCPKKKRKLLTKLYTSRFPQMLFPTLPTIPEDAPLPSEKELRGYQNKVPPAYVLMHRQRLYKKHRERNGGIFNKGRVARQREIIYRAKCRRMQQQRARHMAKMPPRMESLLAAGPGMPGNGVPLDLRMNKRREYSNMPVMRALPPLPPMDGRHVNFQSMLDSLISKHAIRHLYKTTPVPGPSRPPPAAHWGRLEAASKVISRQPPRMRPIIPIPSSSRDSHLVNSTAGHLFCTSVLNATGAHASLAGPSNPAKNPGPDRMSRLITRTNPYNLRPRK